MTKKSVFYRIKSLNIKNQILAAITVNLITFSHGLALGWLSPALLILESDDCPLSSGKITIEQASWIGALICLGSVIGNTLFGCIIDRIGRKITLLLIGIPHMCFWLTIMFGNHVNHLYIGRLLAGTTGGGIFVTIPLFIAEISNNQIRGSLSSILLLFLNFGVLGGYILGSTINYDVLPFVTIWIPLIYMLFILYFPDTPQYWLKSKQEYNAKMSLKFYRNFSDKITEEIKEFNDYFSKLKENIYEIENTKNDNVAAKDFFSSEAIKGIIIGLTLMGINMFCGTFAITNYSSKIFSESGSLLNSNMNTIIIGLIQVLGTCVAIALVDKFGRRPLLLISSTGITIGLMIMGTYLYFRQKMNLDYLHWIPTISLSFVIFIASIGVIPLPVVILAEILPSKIRAIGSTICMCGLSAMAFTILKVFPILMVKINLYGTMWLCGSITLGGIIFIAIFVPETKGKSLDTKETNLINNTNNIVECTHL